MRGAATLALVLVGAGCAACLQPSQKDAKTEALERRVAELEAQLKAKASPSPRGPLTRPLPPNARPRRPQVRSAVSVRATPAQPLVPAPPAQAAGLRDTEGVAAQSAGADAAGEPDGTASGRDAWAIEEGTELELALETPVSSRTSVVGDGVVARVVRAHDPDGHSALPGGTVIEGHVSRVRSAARLQRQPCLAVVFDRIRVAGRSYPLEAIAAEEMGRDEGKRDKGMVAGGTVAGAVVGGVAKGRKGALRGALIGALGGAGAAAMTRGRDVELPAGSRWTITVRKAPRVEP